MKILLLFNMCLVCLGSLEFQCNYINIENIKQGISNGLNISQSFIYVSCDKSNFFDFKINDKKFKCNKDQIHFLKIYISEIFNIEYDDVTINCNKLLYSY